MAACVLFSFTACDILGSLLNKKPDVTEPTESETTTEETTTEETTTTEEKTTTEETTTSEETTTTSEETTSETTATPTPTKKPTAKPTKKPAAKPYSLPKGWTKEPEAWGTKEKGYKAYVAYNKKGQAYGWYNGKWVKLYQTSKGLHNYEDEDHQYCEILVNFYRDKKHKKYYTSYYGD